MGIWSYRRAQRAPADQDTRYAEILKNIEGNELWKVFIWIGFGMEE